MINSCYLKQCCFLCWKAMFFLNFLLISCNATPLDSESTTKDTPTSLTGSITQTVFYTPRITSTPSATYDLMFTTEPKPQRTLTPNSFTISTSTPNFDDDENWAIAFTALIIDDSKDPGRFNHMEVRIIDKNNKEPKRLIESLTSSLDGKWSPYGNKFAFLSFDKVVTSLYILDIDSGHLDEIQNVWSFDWSRNGEMLIYCDEGNWPFNQDFPYHCYTTRIDDLSHRNTLLSVDWHAKELHWSPTEDRIMVLTERQEGPDKIYMIDLSGRIQEIPTQKELWSHIAWHPSGAKIAYDVHPSTFMKSSEIREIDLTTMIERDLTSSAKISSYPQWSPDGTLLAYISMPIVDPQKTYKVDEDPQIENIYLLNLETGKNIKISNSLLEMYYPVWSPDGKYLAFLQASENTTDSVIANGYSLKVFELETGKVITLVSNGLQFLAPAWKPKP